MVQFQAPNIYDAFTQGMADGRNRLRNDMQDAETARLGQARNALSQAIQSGGADSDGARNALAMLDPGSAMTMQRDDARNTRNFDRGVFESDRGFAFQQQGRENTRADAAAGRNRAAASAQRTADDDVKKQNRKVGVAILTSISRLPPEEQEAAYQKGLRVAVEQYGMDVSNLPRNVPDQAGLGVLISILSGQAPDVPKPESDPLAKARALAIEAGFTPGSDEYRQYVVGQGQKAKGLTVNTNPDGTMSLEMGGSGGGGFGTSGNTQLDKAAIDTAEQIDRLNRTAQLYDETYQQIPTRLNDAFLRGKDKLGVASPEEQQEVARFATFKTAALKDLNRTIKALAGAAVSQQEMGRIAGEMPNAGSSVFDGDSPAEFGAKLAEASRSAKLSLVRLNYWKSQGNTGPIIQGGNLVDSAPQLDEIPGIMRQRELEITQQVQAAGYTDDAAIRAQVRAAMQQEFGL
jgi:hypothetical protein